MELLLQALATLSGLVVFVCFVIVIIKMFQNNNAVLGIVSILTCFLGHLIALVVGWKNKDAWKLNTVMPAFLLAYVVWFGSFAGLAYYLYSRPLNNTTDPSSEFGDISEMPITTGEATDDATPKSE